VTLDEALSAAVEGNRVTAPHMQPGCYVEHLMSRGFVRCWKVDRPDEEPSRTQCDFLAHAGDEAAEWRILEPAEQYPPVVRNAWGQAKREPLPVRRVDPAPKPKPEAAPKVEFCAECDFEKSACKCAPKLADQLSPKPVTVGWGNPLLNKEPNKWGK